MTHYHEDGRKMIEAGGYRGAVAPPILRFLEPIEYLDSQTCLRKPSRRHYKVSVQTISPK